MIVADADKGIRIADELAPCVWCELPTSGRTRQSGQAAHWACLLDVADRLPAVVELLRRAGASPGEVARGLPRPRTPRRPGDMTWWEEAPAD